MTQTLPLRAGWNAVYLHVQPEPRSCDDVFASLPVETVWQWERWEGMQSLEFAPDQTFPRAGNWKVWFPSNAPERELNSFGDLLSDTAYLIKVAAGADAFSIGLRGRPVLNRYLWAGNAFNPFGLPVPSSSSPTFTEFFSFTDAVETSFLEGGRIYSIQPNGQEQLVYQPHREAIQRGRAYWILSSELSRYAGPLSFELDSAGSWLDFGRGAQPKGVTVRNVTASARRFRLRHLPSEPAPAVGDFSLVAGPVPLLYGIASGGVQAAQTRFTPMPDEFMTNLAAGASIHMEFRPDLVALTELTSHEQEIPIQLGAFQSVLELSDVNELGRTFEVQNVGVRFELGDRMPGDPVGLWVGDVSVSGVSRARIGLATNWNTEVVQPVGRPFAFRIIVEVTEDGAAWLLQEAFVAWSATDELLIPGGDRAYPIGEVQVLHTRSEADAFLSANPEGKVRRISAINFPFMEPVPLAGSFGGTNVLSGVFAVAYDDKVNPFLHRYNPDHDNVDYRNGVSVPLNEGVESYTVTRQFELAFERMDATGATPEAWGITLSGGTYRETVYGLHAPIKVEGKFALSKVTNVGP